MINPNTSKQKNEQGWNSLIGTNVQVNIQGKLYSYELAHIVYAGNLPTEQQVGTWFGIMPEKLFNEFVKEPSKYNRFVVLKPNGKYAILAEPLVRPFNGLPLENASNPEPLEIFSVGDKVSWLPFSENYRRTGKVESVIEPGAPILPDQGLALLKAGLPSDRLSVMKNSLSSVRRFIVSYVNGLSIVSEPRLRKDNRDTCNTI